MMENFSNKYSKSSNKLDICDTPSKSSPFSVPLEKEQFQVAFYQIYELEPNSISMWDIIKKQNIFYTYFFANQNFYLFLFYPSLFRKNLLSYLTQIQIIKKLDKKPRKIRSTSGFCRYALEIMESSNCKILKTNYDSSFWKKLRVILKRNQKASLTKFLNQTLGEKLRMKKLDRKPSKNLERVLKIRGGEQDLIVQNTKDIAQLRERISKNQGETKIAIIELKQDMLELRTELRNEFYQLLQDTFYLNWEGDPSVVFDKDRFD